MYPGEINTTTLDEYRQLEMQLHLELMNACRKYISQLGIVSIMGATRKNIKKEEVKKHTPEGEIDHFLDERK